MGIVLHQLCQGSSTYRVGNHLGVSVAIVTMFTNDVCQVLVDHFYDTYIKILKGETLQEIMKAFENLIGISYVWGAIDGTHIRLSKKPKQQYELEDYDNQLGF